MRQQTLYDHLKHRLGEKARLLPPDKVLQAPSKSFNQPDAFRCEWIGYANFTFFRHLKRGYQGEV
jgi:hypothetical protein